MSKLKIFASILFIMSLNVSCAQSTTPLYPHAIPNSKPAADEEMKEEGDGRVFINKISVPTISYYPAVKGKSTGQCVIIFPGGGYGGNAIAHEGWDVAKKFNEEGITAFVVKYRIPSERIMKDPSIGPLQDAQQAMIYVRSNAAQWGINPNKIGIMGFSAGGHLASTLGTHYRKALVDNPKNISLRPDFLMLIYPVISSDTAISHKGSFENLLGKNASADKMLEYSNEKQVTDDTPPTFLVHASDDDVVPVENVLVFYEALHKHNVPAELHIYPGGGHGFGLKNPTTADNWMDRAKNWLAQLK